LKEIANINGERGDTGANQTCRRVEKARKRDNKMDNIITDLKKVIAPWRCYSVSGDEIGQCLSL